MSKQKHFKLPIPNWTWWQTTKTIVLLILAFRIDISDEILQLIKVLIKIWSG